MKVLHLFSVLFVFAFLAAGCASSDRIAGKGGEAAADTSSEAYTKAIHVLVDGRDVGTVPRTVRVRRSFGTRIVSLWQSGKEIRTYELPIQPTSSTDQTRMGFWGSSSIDGETYDVRTLPNEDETYQIPFSSGPMKIEDHTYGLTLLIQE